MADEIICSDLDGKFIYEGDEVFGYSQNFAIKGSFELGDISVLEEDHSKPLPVADDPRFRGEVVWCDEMLAYQIKVSELIGKWETQPSRIMMGGGHYAYQLA